MTNCGESSSTSTTAVAPTFITALTVAAKVRLGITTSSPGPIDRAFRANSMATVPFETETLWAAKF